MLSIRMRKGQKSALGAVLVLAATIGAVAVSCSVASATPPPPLPPARMATAVKLVVWAQGLEEPVALVSAPDDPEHRIFVVEKTGRIRILREGRVDAAPLVDLSFRVSGESEQGLLGLALHPQFAKNGRLFVDYTDRQGDTNVVELGVSKSDRNRVDPASERKLFLVAQPYANHNGGHLVFGPDDKLYIGLGDGGSGYDPHGNGQNPQVLLGKMLRLDVDSPAPKPEIVALGLRNPWRYTFDRKTRDLYIADVGQDRFEEVDVVPGGVLSGQNFGWKVREGMHCVSKLGCNKDAFVEPAVEYTHRDGCSITGGYVYRGQAIPELAGHYFYADYCTAMIRSFRWDGSRAVDAYSWRPILDPENKLAKITSFGEDERGELYLMSQEGSVYKMVRSEQPRDDPSR
jgi:glucose/arabinose dehydrogenase